MLKWLIQTDLNIIKCEQLSTAGKKMQQYVWLIGQDGKINSIKCCTCFSICDFYNLSVLIFFTFSKGIFRLKFILIFSWETQVLTFSLTVFHWNPDTIIFYTQYPNITMHGSLSPVSFPLDASWMWGIPVWQSDTKIAGIHERQIRPSRFRFYPLRSRRCVSVASALAELPSRHRVTHFFLALSRGSVHPPECATAESQRRSADVV